MVRLENILWITDFSEQANHALEHARAMAERFGSKLFLLHVIGDASSPLYGEVKGDYLKMEQNARQKAREMMDRCDALMRGFASYEKLIKEGSVLSRILETIEEKHIDNVVMGSQGGGVLRSLLAGSIADKVLRGVRCHVWIIRPQNHS